MTGEAEAVALRGHRQGVVTEAEQAKYDRLKGLETDYRKGMEGAFDACVALAQIHSEDLWKVIGYSTFEAYCKNELGIEKRMAYYQIEAAEVRDAVHRGAPDAPQIPSERVARELAPVYRERGDEGVAEAWGAITADLPEGSEPTGPRVHAALVAKGFRAGPGKASATSGSGRLKTVILLGQFGGMMVKAENRLNWFMTKDIENRRSIGEETTTLALTYAERLEEMAARLRLFAETGK